MIPAGPEDILNFAYLLSQKAKPKTVESIIGSGRRSSKIYKKLRNCDLSFWPDLSKRERRRFLEAIEVIAWARVASGAGSGWMRRTATKKAREHGFPELLPADINEDITPSQQ